MQKTSRFLRRLTRLLLHTQSGCAIVAIIVLLTASTMYAQIWEARYDHLIQSIAYKHGVCPYLVRAIIKVESNFNPRATSPGGDKGLMQLAPSTVEWFNVKNPFDPAENIEGGVRYLKYLKGLFGEDLNAQVCAYNAGHDRQMRGKIPKSTQRYSVAVLAYRDKYEREGIAFFGRGGWWPESPFAIPTPAPTGWMVTPGR